MTDNNTSLEPRVISMGITRVIRLTELGRVILIENMHLSRDVVDGAEVIAERWRVVGKVNGPDRWHEAHVELARLNDEIAAAIADTHRQRGGARVPA